jgi:hypothetical protein
VLESGYTDMQATSYALQFEHLLLLHYNRLHFEMFHSLYNNFTSMFLIICNYIFCDSAILLFEIQSLFIVSLLEPQTRLLGGDYCQFLC